MIFDMILCMYIVCIYSQYMEYNISTIRKHKLTSYQIKLEYALSLLNPRGYLNDPSTDQNDYC